MRGISSPCVAVCDALEKGIPLIYKVLPNRATHCVTNCVNRLINLYPVLNRMTRKLVASHLNSTRYKKNGKTCKNGTVIDNINENCDSAALSIQKYLKFNFQTGSKSLGGIMKFSPWIWKTINAVVYLFGVIFIIRITVFSFFINYHPPNNHTRTAAPSINWSPDKSLIFESEIIELKALWEPKKKALVNSHTLFAENLPSSYFVICLLPETGHVFTSMIFNLDCGCPLSSNSINVLQYIVDNSGDSLFIIDSAFYQEISLNGYPLTFFPLSNPENSGEVISRK